MHVHSAPKLYTRNFTHMQSRDSLPMSMGKGMVHRSVGIADRHGMGLGLGYMLFCLLSGTSIPQGTPVTDRWMSAAWKDAKILESGSTEKHRLETRQHEIALFVNVL